MEIINCHHSGEVRKTKNKKTKYKNVQLSLQMSKNKRQVMRQIAKQTNKFGNTRVFFIFFYFNLLINVMTDSETTRVGKAVHRRCLELCVLPTVWFSLVLPWVMSLCSLYGNYSHCDRALARI